MGDHSKLGDALKSCTWIDTAFSVMARHLNATKGESRARLSAHRFTEPELARILYDDAIRMRDAFQRLGDPCMAHAKRLQARYWARRAFGPFDQPMRYGNWVKIGDEQEQWAWRHA